MVECRRKDVVSMYDFSSLINPPDNPASRAADEAAKVAENTNKIHEEITGIRGDLEKESLRRSKDDKFYFWLGVLFSAVIAFSVQYLPMLIKFLQSLAQQ